MIWIYPARVMSIRDSQVMFLDGFLPCLTKKRARRLGPLSEMVSRRQASPLDWDIHSDRLWVHMPRGCVRISRWHKSVVLRSRSGTGIGILSNLAHLSLVADGKVLRAPELLDCLSGYLA